MIKKVVSLAIISTIFLSSITYAQVDRKSYLSKNTKPVVVNKKNSSKPPVKKPVVKKNNDAKSTNKKQDPIMALKNISFTLKDVDGIKYKSSDIFKKNKLTMVNFWGTLCNPCIKELPELEELNEEMKSKKFGIIGIVGDATNEDSLEDAAAIIDKKDISYANLIPDVKIEKDFLSKMTGYPVSIFVDKNGNIVGEVITGARSKAEYKKIIDKVLGTIK